MKKRFIVFFLFIAVLSLFFGCAGIIPGGGDYDPQPGTIAIENPSPAVAHIMLFEPTTNSHRYHSSTRLLTWRKKGDRLMLSFKKSPILFNEMGYMKGLNGHLPANVWKMIIQPEILQSVNVQILHLIPDRQYVIVAYFTYPVSSNLIPVGNRMFWTRDLYVPAELRAHRDRFGQVIWVSAFVRLPKINTQTISGRFCPEIEIDLP